MKTKIKKIGRGNLNGESLAEIYGSPEKRDERKDHLLSVINNDNSDSTAKTLAQQDYNNIMMVEKETNEKQLIHTFAKFAIALTWVLTFVLIGILIFVAVAIENESIKLEMSKLAQVFAGFVGTLFSLWIGILIAVYRKAKIEVKVKK